MIGVLAATMCLVVRQCVPDYRFGVKSKDIWLDLSSRVLTLISRKAGVIVLGLGVVFAMALIVIVVVMLFLEVTFWFLLACVLGFLSLLLWSSGLHEFVGPLVMVIAFIVACVWCVYRLIKWDLNRLGRTDSEGMGMTWVGYRLLNWDFNHHAAARDRLKPREDAAERFLWANRLGPYKDEP